MYVTLTKRIKRFTKDSFLFRQDRAYRVEEEYGMELCSLTDRDLPLFRMVTAEQAARMTLVDLVEDDDDDDDEPEEFPPAPVAEAPKVETPTEKPVKAKSGAKKLKATGKKAKGKETPPALPPEDDDVEMV